MAEEHHLISNGDVVPQNILRTLFPHLYYIDPLDPNYEHYSQLIRQNGGHITTNQNESAYHLSSSPWDDRLTFLLGFVDHTISNNTPLDLELYRFQDNTLLKKRLNPSYDEDGLHAIDVSNSSPSMEPNAKRQRDKSSKNTTKFTAEADAYILEQVRMRPRFRTSHKFFEDLSKHDMLKGHTGNSVRSRYRAHLEHKLQYVFKTDNYDNLILDEEGQKIPVEVSLAKTMKNKFTAEDDYHLCDDIIRHVSGIRNNNVTELPNGLLDEDKFSVLIAFFDEYARRNPQHSSSSWRDRYRKFARPHGLQRYCEEYIRDCDTKEGPKPMKNMTSRKDRDKGQSRGGAKQAKETKAKSNLSKNAKNPELGDPAAAAVAALRNINMLGHHTSQISHIDHHINPELGMTSRDSVALDEEISGVKNSNIDIVLREVDAGQDMSAIHPSLTGSGVDADVEAIDLSLRETFSQDLSRVYQYLPSNVSLNDILLDEFYDQDSKGIMDKLKEILSSNHTMELDKFSQILQDLGFTEKFIGHVFRVTSASALHVIRYFERVLTLIQDGKTSDVKDFLFINDESGFWTPQSDEALMRGDLANLRHMREEDINQRRFFLGHEA